MERPLNLANPELRELVASARRRLDLSLLARARRKLRLGAPRDSNEAKLMALAHLQRAGRLTVGRFTYGIPQVLAYGPSPPHVEIGAFCSIADEVEIMLNGNHNPQWVSTYPFRLQYRMPGMLEDGHPSARGPVKLGNDVWIARGAFILSGVTIADGAIVAARAVVTKDVAPYSIVAGNPARHVRFRFSDAIIGKLLQIRWWEWPEHRIRDAVPLLSSGDVEAFLQAYG